MPNHTSEVGTFRCPWLLEARQGQRLNISLHTILHYKYRSHSDKWSLKSNSLTSDDASYHPHFSNDGCVEVGVVVDGGVGRRVVKVCQGNARFDHVMLTKTHVARIEFNTLSLLNQLGIFIFEFTSMPLYVSNFHKYLKNNIMNFYLFLNWMEPLKKLF